MGAFSEAEGLPPLLAGTLGGLLTTWVTFTPCFLWIFLGAPFIERLRDNRMLTAALNAITAAVVGVILNLAVWFGMHVIFKEVRVMSGMGIDMEVPVLASMDIAAVALVAAAAVAVFVFRLEPVPVLAGCAIGGLLFRVFNLTLPNAKNGRF